ncbi:hypothetical protein R3X25_09430 [Lutibacter sp. TH_r2]|uniref:hypothetical protein n=1 Tax=Lutibacter sp. TH_r2 TaxID=3082083 RepID=UPI002955948E|nr:hypothetical protein [Lutibacter sp. TH_r2]MDV7187501.1 hypothetical protein [Lutibacter sp. TH_r2]
MKNFLLHFTKILFIFSMTFIYSQVNPIRVKNTNSQSIPVKNVNTNINPNQVPLTSIKIGDITLESGKGVFFFGKHPNYTIQMQELNIVASDGIEIIGTYPNLLITLKKHFIGEKYLGGKVAYVDKTGQHGFVVYSYDSNKVHVFEKSNWATFDWGESQEVNDDLTSNGFSGISYRNWDKYGDVETANTEINSNEFDMIGNFNNDIGFG